MTTVIVIVVIIAIVIAIGVYSSRQSAKKRETRLADAKAEARRWVERLGGQVMNLNGTDTASKQAMADASERYNAAGSQLDQAHSEHQCQLATQTALEGLYYVRAARTAMGMSLGPELPELSSHVAKVTKDREVNVDGTEYRASPNPGAATPHYYPGGTVQGRQVPRGWYSTPWWKTALTGAAAGVGGFLVADALFGGIGGMGYVDGMDGAMGFDGGMGDMGGFGDFGGGDMGDFGGGDMGGFGDIGDFGDFGDF